MGQDTKLPISWQVGNRTPEAAHQLVAQLCERLATRVQFTTDDHNAYAPAVENACGWDGTDHAQLVKLYGGGGANMHGYSPAPQVIGMRKGWVMGKPRYEDLCTSRFERSNLTMRMQMRRFTRLTDGFFKKAENHAHAVALHSTVCRWCRRHGTLTRKAGGVHTTPAMAPGLTARVWTVADLVGSLAAQERKAS